MMSRNTSQISEFQNPHKQVIAHLVTRSFRNYFFFNTIDRLGGAGLAATTPAGLPKNKGEGPCG